MALTKLPGFTLLNTDSFTFGNANIAGNITAGNVKTDHLLYANGTPYVFTTNAAGTNTQVQFNDGNSFAGSANLTFNKTTNTLSVTNIAGNGSGLTSLAGANVTGQVSNSLIAGTVYTNAQPNITSVGTLTGLAASGVINLSTASNVSLGSVANVHITGGTAGYVLSTDGSGSLSWVAQSSGGNAAAIVASQYITKYTLSSAQSLGTSVDTVIAFNNQTYDSQTWFNTGSSQFKPTIAGYYKVTFVVFFTTGGAGTGNQYNIQLRKNGSTINLAQWPELGQNGQSLVITDSVYMNGSTDYLTFTAYSSTAGIYAQNSSNGTYFEAFLIGAAAATSNIGNGQSNINVAASNANIAMSVNGTSNVLVISNTGIVVTGNTTSTYFIGNGSSLTNITGANVTGTVANATYATSAGSANSVAGANVTGTVANATYATTSGSATTAGTVTTAAQPNITSLGTLSSLTVTGNVTAGNIAGGNLVSANYHSGNGSLLSSITGANVTGQVSYAATANSVAVANVSGIGNIATINKDGNASNILYGNGVFAGAPVTYGNSNVTTLLASFGSNSISTTGNITAGNITTSGSGGNISGANTITANFFVGNGASLSAIAGANVTGYVANATHANVADSANSVAVANVTGIGNIATVNKDGNSSNILYGNGVFASAPVTYGNSNVATLLASFGSNSISTTGNATVGNLVVGGNLTINGTLTSINSTIVEIDDLAIVLANDASSSAQANGAGIIINGANANILYNSTSNAFVVSHKISADGGLLSNITGASVTGQVANSLVAGTVYTNAQPNITTVGTLTSLDVTGNVTAGNIVTSGSGGNISGANNITANFFIGNGASLTNIAGANVTGTVANATYSVNAGTANSVAVANVVGIGNIATINKDGNSSNILYGNGVFASAPVTYGNSNVATFLASFGSNSISTTGNVTANYHIGNGASLTSITGANVTGYVANATHSNIADAANSVAVANVTGIGNIATINKDGNSSNILYGNGVFAAAPSGGSAYGNSNVATFLASFGSNSISTTGNITAGNITTSGSGGNISGANVISANTFTASESVDFTTSSNVSLGNVSNLHIDGGTTGQYLKTDGAGNLSWASVSGGSGSGITYTAATTPPGSANVADQWYNTTTNTLYEYMNDGTTSFWVDIQTPTIATSNTNAAFNTAGFNTRTYVGTGSQVNFTITTGLAVSTVLVIQDGVVQTPTSDYTVSGATLTFTTAPANGSNIQIRELGYAIPVTATAAPAGSNNQIQFNNAGLTSASSSLTFNPMTNVLAVVGTVTTSNLSVSSNVALSNVAVSGSITSTSLRAQSMVMGIIFGG